MTTRLGVLFAIMLVACGSPPAPAPSPADTDAQEAKENAREAALASLEPTAVAPQDRAAYFDALDHQGHVRHKDVPFDPEPETVRKVLALAGLVGTGDPALAAKIRGWLLEQAQDYLGTYMREPAAVAALPPDAPWQRSVVAWSAWLTAMLPALDERELRVGDMVAGAAPAGAFPTLDRFALGVAIVDLWIRSGHPKADNQHETFEDVVCDVGGQYGKLSAYCGRRRSWWYRDALVSDDGIRRLAGVVLARKDQALTTAAILGCAREPRTLTLLAALEADAAVWRDAVLAVALIEDRQWLQDWLVPELKKKWRARPEWRGTILFALAEASGDYPSENESRGMIDWTHFARDFDGGVTRDDFVAFLAQSPFAIERARWVLPARTKGWSTVEVILPGLDAYFARPADGHYTPTGAGFSAIPGYLCYHDHDLVGLAKLQTYFAKRAPTHPGDPLNVVMDPYTAKTCRAH